MVITHALRKRFVKDYKLPITVFRDPYFEYLIDAYEHMHARAKYDEFVKLVGKLGGESEFFQESNRIITEMIATVRGERDIGQPWSEQAWSDFQVFNMAQFRIEHEFKKSSPIYIPENDGKWFVSIDLKKANYQSMRYCCGGLVAGTENYEEFISLFTEEPYYKCGATSDELLVFLGDNSTELQEKIKKLLSTNYPNFKVHVKQFKLVKISEEKPYYKREFLDGEWDLRGVPAHYYPEVFKVVMGQPVTEQDRVSFYDGRLVQFIEPLFGE